MQYIANMCTLCGRIHLETQQLKVKRNQNEFCISRMANNKTPFYTHTNQAIHQRYVYV